jgi:hypothetical protein
MTTAEVLRRWAERKWGLAGVRDVTFEHYEGFGGSDVTPAEAEEHLVRVALGDGTCKVYDDVWLTTDLINEILAAGSSATDLGSTQVATGERHAEPA